MRSLIGSLAIFSLTIQFIQAQETLVGLHGNPVADAFYKNSSNHKKSGLTDTLELPFIDDFSDSYIVPNNKKWADNFAFINANYPVSPVTCNVATMDALDYNGAHYPNASHIPYEADHLSSLPVNLSYHPSDSIFLSFFYQPQGFGEMPDTQDSLCLDFFIPGELRWINVWAVPGSPVKDFERVMICIDDEKFLKKGFRFRFRNYASLPQATDQADRRSNVDHWHIDYVILDKNRSISDTVMRDVAFISPLKTILKDFESIPWPHFQSAYASQRKASIDVKYANYDTITRNVTRELRITDQKSGYTYNPVPTANDINTGDTTYYSFPFDYPFNFVTGDSGEFRIRTILKTDAFDYKPNDTLDYFQRFYDYYALDDGTAEAGYGLRGEGTKNASVAVKFNTFRPDTIRAVDMYFNQLPDSLNLDYYFYLVVWENKNGKPGNIKYSQLGMRPAYSESLNQFHRYKLDSAVSVSDTFFIGWTQTVDKLINIGFDRNRSNTLRNFFTSGGVWTTSSFSGSIMIRPVVKMTQLVHTAPIFPLNNNYLVYPNPANDVLFVEPTDNLFNETLQIFIFDISGRVILSESFTGRLTLNVSEIKNGMYLVSIRNKSGYPLSIQKIIIQR